MCTTFPIVLFEMGNRTFPISTFTLRYSKIFLFFYALNFQTNFPYQTGVNYSLDISSYRGIK